MHEENIIFIAHGQLLLGASTIGDAHMDLNGTNYIHCKNLVKLLVCELPSVRNGLLWPGMDRSFIRQVNSIRCLAALT